MNLSVIDWLIVAITLGSMIYSVNMTKGLMKSVTDFLSAGRTAGRYLISVSSGVAGLGAISIIMFLEMGYVAGFSLSWWGLSPFSYPHPRAHETSLHPVCRFMLEKKKQTNNHNFIFKHYS